MLKLTVDYFSSRKFIIDNRFWFYRDNDLYVYDSENTEITDDSVYNDCKFVHFVKSSFDNIEDMCIAINERRPISSRTITVDEYIQLLSKSYPNLRTALNGILRKTEFVKLVDARYMFSMFLNGEYKNIILCHDKRYHGISMGHSISIDNDDTTKRIEKYITITEDTQVKYSTNWTEMVIWELDPEFQ